MRIVLSFLRTLGTVDKRADLDLRLSSFRSLLRLHLLLLRRRFVRCHFQTAAARLYHRLASSSSSSSSLRCIRPVNTLLTIPVNRGEVKNPVIPPLPPPPPPPKYP